MHFLFNTFALDTAWRELRRGGHPLSVEPKVFDLLVFLIANREHVVSKDDLVAAIWNVRIVSDFELVDAGWT